MEKLMYRNRNSGSTSSKVRHGGAFSFLDDVSLLIFSVSKPQVTCQWFKNVRLQNPTGTGVATEVL